MTACFGPGPCEVVGHEIDKVEVGGSLPEIDIFQRPLACWEGSGENVVWRRERRSECGQKLDVVLSLLRIGWMLPVDFAMALVSKTHCKAIALLSMPFSPNRSTSSLALWANASRAVLLAATAAKFALPSPPPPIERRILSCGYTSSLCAVKPFRQPRWPSTSILVSA